VSIIVEDIDDSAAERPATALLLGLPEDISEWVSQNRELISRVQGGLTSSYAEITPEQIWQAIVIASGDPHSVQALEEMLTAKKIWDELNDPSNAPLGAIGRALESDKTDSARERYFSVLANFTIVSEGLMERRPDLAKLLNVLLVQKRMLDQSLRRTQEVKQAAEYLGERLSLSSVFGSAARRPSRISRQFKAAIRLLAPKKQFNATSVTVPWSQGI